VRVEVTGELTHIPAPPASTARPMSDFAGPAGSDERPQDVWTPFILHYRGLYCTIYDLSMNHLCYNKFRLYSVVGRNHGARRHGQEMALVPVWKCCKVFLCSNSYSKTFRRVIFTTSRRLGLWDFALKPPPEIHPWTPLRDFRPQSAQTPNLFTPGKKSCGRSWRECDATEFLASKPSETFPDHMHCLFLPVVRPVTPSRSKPARYFRSIVCIKELRDEVVMERYRGSQSSGRGPQTTWSFWAHIYTLNTACTVLHSVHSVVWLKDMVFFMSAAWSKLG